MNIDWFTFIAQVVNFIILVLLLRRFLFRPIINAMDEREKRIAERLGDAARSKESAEREAAEYRQRNEEFEREKESLMASVRADAEGWRKEQLRQAREEVDETASRWRQSLSRERESFLKHLKRRANDELLVISRKTLADLADESLESKMAAAFINQLHTEDAREAIRGFAEASAGELTLRTAFPLNDDQRDQIERAIGEIVQTDGETRAKSATTTNPELNFRVEERLIAGIELLAGGFKVSWSVDQYLEELEAAIRETMADGVANGEEPRAVEQSAEEA